MRSKKVIFLLFIVLVTLLSSGCIFSDFFNRRPVIETISDQIGKVGQEFIYQVIAYDPDNGELTYSLTEKPEDMQIESSTGLINWIPGEDQIGTFTVEVKVSDGSSFNIEKFEITIEDIFLTSIEVSPANINIYVGNSTNINSIIAFYNDGSNNSITLSLATYQSSNINIATVNNNGLITGISTGTTVITVSYTEGDITKADTVEVTVENVYLTSIDVLPPTMSVYIGNFDNITSVTAHYSDGSSLSIGLDSAIYSSDNTDIATVSTTGKVTGISKGTTIIIVTYTEGGITKTGTVGVTVLRHG